MIPKLRYMNILSTPKKEAALDPSADRIWTIGQIIYQRHHDFNRSSPLKQSQDNGSFDYIDMVSQNSLILDRSLNVINETFRKTCNRRAPSF
ncbi:hypothetical protein B9Z55_009736 [Caenorhabditis nigoni]|uniref:Uncharacterized protein n=1 Tax=Caenorhabditis nigoni TaxID=1611254 RepID=A0A2G5UTA5_9PELO|nr:hypothetical protein B9Z55_009736 [Caenorhabditis nigoni]